MKKINFVKCMLAMLLFAGVLASCSNEFDAIENSNEFARSSYGDYQVSVVLDVVSEMKSQKSDFDLNSLPILDKTEIYSLLNKLNGLTVNETDRKNVCSEDGMTTYTLSTSGIVDDYNGLSVDIDFIEYDDDNSLYYKSNRLSAAGDDMYVIGKGFSLATENNLYKVIVTGIAYFKTIGDDNVPIIVSVPLELNGKLDVVNGSCNYICNLR